jgi:hypothetical protein
MLRCTVLAVCVSQFAPANTRIYGKAALETRFDHEVFLISGSDQFGKLGSIPVLRNGKAVLPPLGYALKFCHRQIAHPSHIQASSAPLG